MKIAALLLFALLYFLMIVKPKYRPFYALGTAVIFLVSGILPISSLPGVINWNVLMMISGTLLRCRIFWQSFCSRNPKMSCG